MFFVDFSFALVVGLLLTALFAAIFDARGPWDIWWAFLLIVFLAAWVGGVWVTPFGPTLFEVAWLPFLFVGLIFALLMAAIPPTRPRTYGKAVAEARAEETAVTVLSIFFWLLIVLMVIALIVAYIWSG
jgi:hypothetical protein